jgi:beta-glucosidase
MTGKFIPAYEEIAIMADATFRFPKGFLWGTATAAHQVEGQNENNNWYDWENQSGHIHNNEKAGLACDWWNSRWEEDLTNAAQAGQNAHRFSIEWSRIQPAANTWDEKAMEKYRLMIQGMRKLGLEPMLTLHHFTEPLWIYHNGGWENPKTVDHFTSFVRYAVDALKDLVTIWVTINEPAVFTVGGYLGGGFPPGKNDLGKAYTVLSNLVKAHAAAYHAIHQLQPDAKVGVAKQYRAMAPSRPWFPPDRWITNFSSTSFNDAFMGPIRDGIFKFSFKKESIPQAIGTQDFVGINYYSQDQVRFKPLAFDAVFQERHFLPGAQLSETGFIANVPDGMHTALKWAHHFNLPIYITENGVEDAQDTMRPAYLLEHLRKVWDAANSNWQVKGYFHWSQMDNFEWERGWSQRFGLWCVDPASQQRERRPSAALYEAICKENAISTETVRKHAPAMLEKFFPG